MKAHVAVFMFLVACGGGGSGGGGGGDDVATPDAKIFLDAPPVVPSMITFSGIASERSISGSAPVAGLTVAIFKASDDATALSSVMTDAQGMYSLTITTDGAPLDGFLKATKSGYVEAYLYPASPFIADYADGSLNMLTQTNYDFLSTLAQGNQQAGKALIGLQISDASGQPVAGVMVSSTPAAMAYRYNGSNELPSSTATSTGADGIAYMFNVTPGMVTISATKSGMTFHSHALTARADKFTTTSITP